MKSGQERWGAPCEFCDLNSPQTASARPKCPARMAGLRFLLYSTDLLRASAMPQFSLLLGVCSRITRYQYLVCPPFESVAELGQVLFGLAETPPPEPRPGLRSNLLDLGPRFKDVLAHGCHLPSLTFPLPQNKRREKIGGQHN